MGLAGRPGLECFLSRWGCGEPWQSWNGTFAVMRLATFSAKSDRASRPYFEYRALMRVVEWPISAMICFFMQASIGGYLAVKMSQIMQAWLGPVGFDELGFVELGRASGGERGGQDVEISG